MWFDSDSPLSGDLPSGNHSSWKFTSNWHFVISKLGQKYPQIWTSQTTWRSSFQIPHSAYPPISLLVFSKSETGQSKYAWADPAVAVEQHTKNYWLSHCCGWNMKSLVPTVCDVVISAAMVSRECELRCSAWQQVLVSGGKMEDDIFRSWRGSIKICVTLKANLSIDMAPWSFTHIIRLTLIKHVWIFIWFW